MLARLVCYGLAVLCISTLIKADDQKSYDGYTLFQVYPDTQEKVEYLMSLEITPGPIEVQIWRAGTVKTSFDILVSPSSKEALLKELDGKQIKYEVKNENIQDSIEKEQKPTGHNRAFPGVKYLSLDETNKFVKELAARYPNIVSIDSLGPSFENRPITVVKVGTNTGKNKPSIWIDGGIHAREWIAVSTVTYMLNKLVTGYASDPKIKKYVDMADWYFVPVLNVDGYDHTHKKDRMWRKNRRNPPCRMNIGTVCCYGVDLNRNFDMSFGGAGTSPDSCQDSYRGQSAFSEPETRAVRDFVLKHSEDMKAFITIHAYMQMWFYPYADKKQSYPADIEILRNVSARAVQAIANVHGTQFTVGTPADILYPAAGGSFDWVKSVAQVKYTFGMELRPDSKSKGNGFVLPTSQIIPAGEETWAGISVVADQVISEFAN